MIITNYFMDSLVRSSIMEYCRLDIYGFSNNLHKVINYFLLAVLQICQILILVFSFLGLLILENHNYKADIFLNNLGKNSI